MVYFGVNTLKTNEQTLRSYGFRPFSENKKLHQLFAGASAEAFFLETPVGCVVLDETDGGFDVQAHDHEGNSYGALLDYPRLAVSVTLAVGSLLRSGKAHVWQDVQDWLEEL